MDSGLASLLETLYRKTGRDFRGYRESTLERRIARRLQATRSPDYPSYITHLEKSSDEPAVLIRDMTISVTDFFRDWDEELLRTLVWPELSGRAETRTHSGFEMSSKIWSAGCATGEEAYSLAFSLDRYLEEKGSQKDFAVTGTDSDESSLAIARAGVYPEEKARNLPREILARHFEMAPKGMQVASQLRAKTSFFFHDLAASPASQRFDLVSCRNVLIYFSRPLQEKALENLFLSLKPGGFLWLGKAEYLWGEVKNSFETVHPSSRLFRKEK